MMMLLLLLLLLLLVANRAGYLARLAWGGCRQVGVVLNVVCGWYGW